MACVQKIVAVFEAPGYDDTNAADIQKVVDLMSEVDSFGVVIAFPLIVSQMQSYGAPPESIMGPLPPGFGFGPDGLSQMGEGCVVM